MASEKQIAANRANSKKSTGPKTYRGKARSAMNATTHGLTSKTIAMLHEDSIEFENRLMKSLAIRDVQDDNEEFLTYLNVCQESDFKRAHKAHMRRIKDLIETADQTEAEEVYRLGKRLFFDRNGPIDVYGSEEVYSCKKTSPNEQPVDPDDPAILVKNLESSAKGCEWLREQWEQLKAPLVEPQGYWVGCHRLMAIRLLGQQPVSAIRDRLVAEVFVASFALKRDRQHAFSDLLDSDLGEEQLGNLDRSAFATWPGLIEIEEESQGRAILLDIVDSNIERLDDLIKAHAENADDQAEGQFERLGADPSRESHNLRAYKQKCQNAYYRGQTACQNYKKLNGTNKEAREREEWCDNNGQLIKHVEERGAARRPEWEHADRSSIEAGERLGRLTPAGRGDRIKPAGGNGVNGEHMIAERDRHDTIIRENEANFDEHVSIDQEQMPADVMANSDALSGLDTGGKANFVEQEIGWVVDEAGAVLHRLSPVAADCPYGTDLAEAVSEHVIAKREHQNGIPDENEANLDDHVSSAQEPVAVDVMENSDALAGLDNAGKANFGEPEFERLRDENEAEVGVTSDRGGELADGARLPEPLREQRVVVGDRGQNRRGDRTGCATSKKEKKRLRREMAQREMERRRAARPMESEPRCDEGLGGVDSIFPDVGVVDCGHHSRAP